MQTRQRKLFESLRQEHCTVDGKQGDIQLAEFIREGVLPWPAPDGETEAALWILARNAVTNSDGVLYNTDRTGHKIPIKDVSEGVWQHLLTPRLVNLLFAYFQKEPVLHCIFVVQVPPFAPAQLEHRDHNAGARVAVCLVVSFDPVTTLVKRGSHVHRSTQGLAPATTERGLLFDTHIIHAGASNPTELALTDRVFFQFEAKLDANNADKIDRVRAETGYTGDLPVLLTTLCGLNSRAHCSTSR